VAAAALTIDLPFKSDIQERKYRKGNTGKELTGKEE
jgi:hypothetical protein